MSETNIEVPAEHIEAVRQSLVARRDEPGRAAEVDDLLAQLARADGAAPCALSGRRELVWGTLYDSLCMVAEQLADDCNEYWGGAIDPDFVRARIAAVAARFELLAGLGAPPAG